MSLSLLTCQYILYHIYITEAYIIDSVLIKEVPSLGVPFCSKLRYMVSKYTICARNLEYLLGAKILLLVIDSPQTTHKNIW